MKVLKPRDVGSVSATCGHRIHQHPRIHGIAFNRQLSSEHTT